MTKPELQSKSPGATLAHAAHRLVVFFWPQIRGS